MATRENVPDRDFLAAQIARFPLRDQRRLSNCAALSARIAQLATSFPVLFFALATSFGPLAARRTAVMLADDGAPLAEVAAAIGLPSCFRRLPPEACRRPLPAVRWSVEANRKLASHVPVDPAPAAGWLGGVSFAAWACDEPFAVWLARQHVLFEDPHFLPSTLLPLALFAWHSRHADKAETIVPSERWSERLSYHAAVARLEAWLRMLAVDDASSTSEPRDRWLAGDTLADFRFLPLTTYAALRDEGQAMRNCVAQYAPLVAMGRSRLFSVRHEGRRVATLEIRRGRSRAYVITQMKGPANRTCGLDVWEAASAWVETSDFETMEQQASSPRQTADDRLRATITRYRRALPHLDEPWIETVTYPAVLTMLRLLARPAPAGHGRATD